MPVFKAKTPGLVLVVAVAAGKQGGCVVSMPKFMHVMKAVTVTVTVAVTSGCMINRSTDDRTHREETTRFFL